MTETLKVPLLEHKLLEFTGVEDASGRSFVAVGKGPGNELLPLRQVLWDSALFVGKVCSLCPRPRQFLRSLAILSLKHNTLRFQLLERRAHDSQRPHGICPPPSFPR